MGLEPIVAPLFTIRPIPWYAPDPADFDAVMLTSANSARLGGAQLAAFLHLPCYVVGEATATAADAAGFKDIRIGDGAAKNLVAMMERQRVRAALHLTGKEHLDDHPDVIAARVIVYASDAVGALAPQAIDAVTGGAAVLLHSPRAAALFSRLWQGDRSQVSLVAISEAAATAAGSGWNVLRWPWRPRDHAVLELAASLCKTAPSRGA